MTKKLPEYAPRVVEHSPRELPPRIDPALEATADLPCRDAIGKRPCTQCGKDFLLAPGDTTTVCQACTAENVARVIQNSGAIEEIQSAPQAKLSEVIALISQHLTPIATKELAKRELVRRRLLDFTQRFNTKYTAGWVHELICEKLDRFSLDVAFKKAPRLMIFMPPRHGKSELASVNFPAHHLGRYPDHEIIACSYASSLPESFSRRIKGIIATPDYQVLFPNTVLDPNAQATSGWHTLQGGGYLPAGVGGGITGRGAHVLIIDDPVRDSEEADSESQRDKAWDWYGSTARTRLAPGAGILVIQTRWNDDDLSGRILTKEAEKAKKEGWEVLIFPALAEQDEYWSTGISGFEPGRIVLGQPEFAKDRLLRRTGEALHPERYSLDELMAQKSVLQPRHWSALFQQNPAPDEGEFFKKSMFRFEPEVFGWKNSEFSTYIAWDLASSDKRSACYVVGVVGCVDFDGNIHILDMVRFRGSEQIVPSIIALYKKYKPKLVGIENGQILQAIRPQLSRIARGERLPISYDETLKPVTDKTVRAQPLQGLMQNGQVYFPSNQPWVDTIQHELLRFPAGTYDDIVDALAWLARMMIKEPVPRRVQPKKIPSWRDKIHEYTRGRRGSSQSNAALDA